MKKIFLAAGLILTFFWSCEKDYKKTDVDTFTWNPENIEIIKIESYESDVVIHGSTESVLNASHSKTCVDHEEDVAENEVKSIYFIDSVFSKYIKLVELTDCINCNCGKSLSINAVDTIMYDISVETGSVSIKNMKATGRIENAFGRVNLVKNRGSIKVKATGIVDCEYEYAGKGDTIIIDNYKGDVMLRFPSNISATFDLETKNGTIKFFGITPNYMLNEEKHKMGTIGSNTDRALIKVIASPYSGEGNIEVVFNEI